MTEDRYEPTKAEFLAGLITGDAGMSQSMATVQRSHRFPVHIFAEIENMAKMADAPVSLIINQLLECGLDEVRKELPEDLARQLRIMSKEQVERPMKSDRVEVKIRNPASRKKVEDSKAGR